MHLIIGAVAVALGLCVGGALQSLSTVLTTVPNQRTIVEYDATVREDEIFHMTYDIQRYWTSCSLVLDRYFKKVDTKNNVKLSHEERFIQTNTTMERISFLVPRGTVEPGVYEFYSKVAYTCNFMHKLFGPWVVTTDGVRVTVTAAKEK